MNNDHPHFDERYPVYREVLNQEALYTPERTITIDGHEIYWMRYDGHITFDITGAGREGQPYTGKSLMCECEFTEGVGWKYRDDGEPSRYVFDRCIFQKLACSLRCAEIRREYLDSLGEPWNHWLTEPSELVLYVWDRHRNGDWVGSRDHELLYMQTVAEIGEWSPMILWPILRKLQDDKKLSVHGAILIPYREPPPLPVVPDGPLAMWVMAENDHPRLVWWSKLDSRYLVEVIRMQPYHGVLRLWDYGLEDEPEILQEPVTLAYDAEFGPDTDDVTAWEERSRRFVDETYMGGK